MNLQKDAERRKKNHKDNNFTSTNRNFYRMKIRDEEYKIKKYRSKITAESNNNSNDNSKWSTRIKECEERIQKHIQDVKRSVSLFIYNAQFSNLFCFSNAYLYFFYFKKKKKIVVRDTHSTAIIPTEDDDRGG